MSQDLTGTELAGYRIERVLARGGMGVLYVAEDLALGRKVALKVIAPELANDPAFRERFIRESRLTASIDHPNVIPIHRAGEEHGTLFLAMRLVDGTDLRTIIEGDRALGVERAASIVTQVAAALDAAHAHGLVHRDVKPANILVATSSGDAPELVYLSDFGLTKPSAGETGITRTGQFLGTADYAAPEQFEGRAIDGRADLYSLGCVLFECLSGRPPFPRDSEVAAMYAHLRERAPVVTDRRPELPAALDEVVATAMAKDPQKRFQSGRELAAALTAATGPDVVAGPRPHRLRPRRPLLIGGVSAAVAVVAAVTIAVATKGTGPNHPAEIAIRPGSLAKLDPNTGRVLADYPFPTTGGELTESGGALYALDGGTQTISKIDPRTGSVVATTGGVASPCGLFPDGEGGLWVSSCEDTVTRLGSHGLERLLTFDVPSGLSAASVALLAGSMWVSTDDGDDLGPPDVVLRMDPNSGRVLARVKVGLSPFFMAVGAGRLWAANYHDGTLSEIDPATDRATTTGGFVGPLDMVATDRQLWITDFQDRAVYEYDMVQHRVVNAFRNLRGRIVVAPGAVWVLDPDTDVLTRINPESGNVVSQRTLASADGIALAAGSLWLTAPSI